MNMDEENNVDWQQAKKFDEDMLNYGKYKTVNENKKSSTQKNTDTSGDTASEENLAELDTVLEEETKNKFGFISVVILTILLFIVGIFIGNKLLEIDEKTVPTYVSKEVSEKKIEEKEENDELINKDKEESIQDEEDESLEEAPIMFAVFHLKNPNENNKDCSISFGKEKNFSISLGKNGAYIYGEYHIDGNAITCNAITWRNAEKQEAINSTIKFRIIEKDEVQISEVNIYEGNEGLDKELINLDGLRVGMTYVWN